MKRFGLILLVVSFVIGSLTFVTPASAQYVYLGMYWIAGYVEDPDNVGTEGRQVVFFKTLENNSIVGGYADDVVGPDGLSGRDNEYMINAYAYKGEPLDLATGLNYAAMPNDNPINPQDGYGANPVEVNVTGQGYDIAPNLVLVRGGGILPPPVLGLPVIEEVRYGNRIYYEPAVKTEDWKFVVDEQPKVITRITSVTGLNTSKIFMNVNPNTPDSMQIGLSEATEVTMVRPAGAPATALPTEVTFVYDFKSAGKTLADGENKVDFSAANAAGTAVYNTVVTVMGGEGRLIGVPLTYPSPVQLKYDKEVIVQFTLNKPMPIGINFYDVSGRMVKRLSYDADTEGGSAGTNKVTWDLITDQGQIVSSGICVFTIVDLERNKVLGTGKFTAVPSKM